jgi:hypothetical protein
VFNPYAIKPASADTEQSAASVEDPNGASAAAVNRGMNNVENSADDVETLINEQKKTIRDLQEQMRQNQVLQNQSYAERKLLSDSLKTQMQYLNVFNENWKDYKGNVHALQAEVNAKKYLPWGYALVALILFRKNTVQDNALIGLAGYGTGALIEQTDHGIAHYGTRMLFKMGYSF